MKKFIVLLLTVTMLMSLFACGKKDEESNETSGEEQVETTVENNDVADVSEPEDKAEEGQHQMVEQIAHFFHEGEILEVIAGEAAQREYVQIGAAGEEDDEENAEGITRHHIARENETAAKGIQFAAVMHGLPEAKRNADEVTEEE